ncbi:MAG: flagellar protein [Lachnospiraceae bacterium]|nr:flagellar protein [Lachnospiraceae bacterium]
MDTRVCKRCRLLFNYIGGEQYCPSCREALEDDFQKVKNYVRENPGCTIIQVVRECDVTEKQIREWIRQERLELTGEAGIYCQKCGSIISSGTYCEKCKAEMTNMLNEAARSMMPTQNNSSDNSKKPSSSKMRFLDY